MQISLTQISISGRHKKKTPKTIRYYKLMQLIQRGGFQLFWEYVYQKGPDEGFCICIEKCRCGRPFQQGRMLHWENV